MKVGIAIARLAASCVEIYGQQYGTLHAETEMEREHAG